MRTVSLFFVTTSSCREWVIYAPAAFLGCGSRFSGSLSGVEPLFSVTRYNHGSRINYHQQLIRQTLERCVAGTRPCDLLSYSDSPIGRPRSDWFCSNKCTRHLKVRSLIACISSRITTVIQVGFQDQVNNGCCNELFAASLCLSLCLDMHGLIFETSI